MCVRENGQCAYASVSDVMSCEWDERGERAVRDVSRSSDFDGLWRNAIPPPPGSAAGGRSSFPPSPTGAHHKAESHQEASLEAHTYAVHREPPPWGSRPPTTPLPRRLVRGRGPLQRGDEGASPGPGERYCRRPIKGPAGRPVLHQYPDATRPHGPTNARVPGDASGIKDNDSNPLQAETCPEETLFP
ncbi:unnamed protein product [Boreogadus saida]